jgi:glycosyltransferase involved in cell wall biosynthesis
MHYSPTDVSILIPVYCESDEQVTWFKECLESALNQDCPVVVVSDASPKPINHIIHDLWETRIKHVRLPTNRGVAYARNVAADLAGTKLLYPLDADDTIRSDAILALVESFRGIPTYSDIRKFGIEEVPHYKLLDFDCDLIYNKVGLASVNVLHTKEQWSSIHGWKEDIDFYEDGEYNARLMISYCGVRLPLPLVNYRQYPYQRTRKYKKRAAQQGKIVRNMIMRYGNMASRGCCGKGRVSRVASMSVASSQSAKGVLRMNTLPSDMPGSQGDRVLATYVGGQGRGKHYYRGLHTKYGYKVLYGEHYYVDPRDLKEPGDTLSRSLFVKVVQEKPAEVKEVKKPKVSPRKPRKTPKKAPIESTNLVEPLPDIRNMKWYSEIRHTEFEPEAAAKLYKIEKNGKARVKVLAYLKKAAKS